MSAGQAFAADDMAARVDAFLAARGQVIGDPKTRPTAALRLVYSHARLTGYENSVFPLSPHALQTGASATAHAVKLINGGGRLLIVAAETIVRWSDTSSWSLTFEILELDEA